jgi:hypothetical protein
LAKVDDMLVLNAALVRRKTVGDGSPVPTPNGRGDLAPTQCSDCPTEKIAKTDAEIDRMVYDLYGLTTKEIAIMEEK